MIQNKKIESCIIVKIIGSAKRGANCSTKWMPKYLPWLFPGTLNLLLRQNQPKINWHTYVETEFGNPVKVADCLINNEPAFIVFPPRAIYHPRKIEIGAKFKIREKYNLADGDSIEVTFF